MDAPTPLRRVLAGVSGIAMLLGFALAAALYALAASYATVAPDPFDPDGDPCCGVAHRPGDLDRDAMSGVALAVLAALLLTGAIVLLMRSIRGRDPSWRRVAVVPGAVAVLASGLVIALALTHRDDGPHVDCGRFAFDRAAWGDGSRDEGQALGVEQCGLLIGRTRAQVRALLGSPATTHGETAGGEKYWSWSLLEVRFDGDRADHARAGII